MFVSHPTQYDDPPSRCASIYMFMGMAPNLTWHSGGPRKQVATSYCWMVVPLFIVSRSLRVKTEDYPKKVATDARHGTSHALGRSRSLFSHR